MPILIMAREILGDLTYYLVESETEYMGKTNVCVQSHECLLGASYHFETEPSEINTLCSLDNTVWTGK